MQATDKDFPQRGIVYSISTGGASQHYPNIFWINPQTGELQLVTKADYETTPFFILRIQATNGEDSSSVTVSGAIWCIHTSEVVDFRSPWHPPGVAVAIRNLNRAPPADMTRNG